MRKFFLYLTIAIFAILTISPFLAGYYEPAAVFFAAEASLMKNSFAIMLISGIAAWSTGVGFGFLHGLFPKPLQVVILCLIKAIRLIPSFLLSAIIILLLGSDWPTVLCAAFIPAFAITARTTAPAAAKLRDGRYKRIVTINTSKKAYNQGFLLPLFWHPAFNALLCVFRMILYIDVILGVLGLIPSYTLGSGILQIPKSVGAWSLLISVVMIALINTACVLSKTNKTEGIAKWLKH